MNSQSDFPYLIEKATWKDIASLKKLERQCFTKDIWPIWDLIGILTFPNVIRLKAVSDEQMVGFIGIDVRPSKDTAMISTISVHPQHQRKGIGGVLLKAVEDGVNLSRIRLYVRASNTPAVNLYLKSGYSHIGRTRKYYYDGEDALVMEKKLC